MWWYMMMVVSIVPLTRKHWFPNGRQHFFPTLTKLHPVFWISTQQMRQEISELWACIQRYATKTNKDVLNGWYINIYPQMELQLFNEYLKLVVRYLKGWKSRQTLVGCWHFVRRTASAGVESVPGMAPCPSDIGRQWFPRSRDRP